MRTDFRGPAAACVLALALAASPRLAAEGPAVPLTGLAGLAACLEANQAEERLAEYKDGPEAVAAKLRMLERINANRAAAGATPVELDILASRVANRQCLEAATSDFTGHWNERGEKPYQRWAFAGGRDHVGENASAMWSTANLDPGAVEQYMARAHESFMAERAPSDGHRRQVLDKAHTHVGLGFALRGGQFRYYEEYLDRYFELIEGPDRLVPGQRASWRFLPREGYYVYAAIVYWEPLPRPMTPSQLKSMGSYPDYSNRKVLSLWPRDLPTAEGGGVEVSAAWTEKGSYYVQVYLDTKAPELTGRYSTVGKTQASGLVVLVQ